ncbi:hypothetical protein AB0H36_24150 [Kribbella sp. NPDC050820]|uniref:hypothetical protein n=1 Tax=Kribbella sp. NPDC050820 TaxID=3155408 RepID=UPI0033F810C5
MRRYRLLINKELFQQLIELERAAKSQQPGGLRHRELRALRLGLRALANGEEERYNGKRLGFMTHDLSDCAEIKLPVVAESRHNRELGPSHRLVYREFEPVDGGLPYREVVSFEPRGDDRPFDVAASRLGRNAGVRRQTVYATTATSRAAPIRQPLPPDLRQALSTAFAGVPPSGSAAAPRPPTMHRHIGPRRGAPPNREL